jgi:hypothetical protein
MDRRNQLERIKYETDPEFRDRKRKWHEENREDMLEYYRKEAKKTLLPGTCLQTSKEGVCCGETGHVFDAELAMEIACACPVRAEGSAFM